MAIRVKCPKCQKKLQLPDGIAGKKARCPACETRFRLPGSAPARPARPARPATPPPPPPEPDSHAAGCPDLLAEMERDLAEEEVAQPRARRSTTDVAEDASPGLGPPPLPAAGATGMGKCPRCDSPMASQACARCGYRPESAPVGKQGPTGLKAVLLTPLNPELSMYALKQVVVMLLWALPLGFMSGIVWLTSLGGHSIGLAMQGGMFLILAAAFGWLGREYLAIIQKYQRGDLVLSAEMGLFPAFGMVLAVVVIGFAPLIGVVVLAVQGGLSPHSVPTLVLVTFLFGLVYCPMGLAAVAVEGALNPVRVLRMIGQRFVPYVMVVVFMVPVLLLSHLVSGLVRRAAAEHMPGIMGFLLGGLTAATLAQYGIVCCMAMLGRLLREFPERRPLSPAEWRTGVLTIGGAVVAGGVLFLAMASSDLGSLIGAIANADARAKLSMCRGDQHQLGLALANYEEANGHFPYGTIPNQGLAREKRLSFLVELLPYQDQKALYDRIDLEKAWDHPDNAGPLKTPLRAWTCPAQARTRGAKGYGVTHYVGNGGVGPDGWRAEPGSPECGLFTEGGPLRIGRIADGTAQTILVTEVNGNVGPWGAGGDSSVRSLDPGAKPLNDERGTNFGSPHPGGALVTFCDTHVTFVSETIDPKVFRALVTSAGGEVIESEDF